ncbi:MAG: hypothetical protein R3B89_01395 [Polyangiaceae bacterium]
MWRVPLFVLLTTLVLAGCDSEDSKRTSGSNHDAGADGSLFTGGSGGQAGSGGMAGMAGVGGSTGGSPGLDAGIDSGSGGTTAPDPGAPGTRVLSGGAYMKSSRFNLMISAGQSPGSQGKTQSPRYSAQGGLVGSVH